MNIEDLRELRNQRLFDTWAGSVAPEKIAASEEAVRRLIDQLMTLGAEPNEATARSLVQQCVSRFNELDDGWICTIEREDIFERLCQALDLCGLSCDEDWLDEREW
jgi:hypothetical protein